jgi:hypothetical protein
MIGCRKSTAHNIHHRLLLCCIKLFKQQLASGSRATRVLFFLAAAAVVVQRAGMQLMVRAAGLCNSSGSSIRAVTAKPQQHASATQAANVAVDAVDYAIWCPAVVCSFACAVSNFQW